MHIDRADLTRIVLVGVAALATWLRWLPAWHGFDPVAIVAIAVGGFPIYEEAWEAIRERRMTMELSMTIALVAALCIGEYLTTLLIVFFVLIAEVLEHLTVERGRKAVKQLLEYLPAQVSVTVGSQTQTVDRTQVKAGDVVVVHPGECIAVDGQVIDGHSHVDQSSITGEALPIERTVGDPVFAGSINQTGALQVRATEVGPDTTFGKIIQAVEEAEKSRAPVQKTADRLAGYLVYFALACALVTFVLTHNARSTISVVIVAGACGIAAGTPLAILGAIGRCAADGSIVKGGLHLETLSTVDTVVFDKTGTLTRGTPQVGDVIPVGNVARERVLELAATAEQRSEHPLGRAIVAACPSPSRRPLLRFEYTPGGGIVCADEDGEICAGSRRLLEGRGISLEHAPPPPNVGSEVLLSYQGILQGAIHLQDTIRPESADAMAQFHQLGLAAVLLTGDSEASAQHLAGQVHLDRVAAGLLPHEKLEYVRRLMAEGRTVAMVGDGINDAPALMQASVGIAMGSGTDVARESAGIVLLGDDLLRLVQTFKTARQCRAIIMTNFVGTLVVDGIGLALAAFGFLNPLLAALIHVTSELAFIGNSARLLPRPRTTARLAVATRIPQPATA